MDPFSLRLLLLLLPGLVCSFLIEKITIHKHWDGFRFTVYLFFLGLVSYVLMQVVFVASYLFVKALNITSDVKISDSILDFWGSLIDNGKNLPISEIALSILFALILATGLSYISKVRFLQRVMALLGCSNKYGDENLFTYFLDVEAPKIVRVRDFNNNYAYEGTISAFSEADNLQELFLEKVNIYQNNTSKFLYQTPKVYISFNSGNFLIEEPEYDSEESEYCAGSETKE